MAEEYSAARPGCLSRPVHRPLYDTHFALTGQFCLHYEFTNLTMWPSADLCTVETGRVFNGEVRSLVHVSVQPGPADPDVSRLVEPDKR